VIAYTYYQDQKEQVKAQDTQRLKEYSKELISNLSEYKNSFSNSIIYPRSKIYNSAIYDIDKKLIFSTCKAKDLNLDSTIYYKDDHVYFVDSMMPYYLGGAYVVIEAQATDLLERIEKKVIIMTLFIISIIIVTSIFLVRIVLKPIRDSLGLLDRFIKDTTHELNTPVSTILTNIELIESANHIEPTLKKKIDRIKIASMTISNLYEDLVFLVLKHSVSSQEESVDINRLVKERVEYFDLFFKSKNIDIYIEEIDQSTIEIDRKKITKVIDNLISNSIKYSKKNKRVDIKIDTNSFAIKDQGKGMSEDQLKKVFDRYSRFDKTQGGFGIGYNIIYSILTEYDIDINIDSKIDEGTCVTLNW
jgi:two-component system OmpR family sensor kinase